ncbi:MAG: GEVED domain-containing protein [Bacteroidota bacterium]
MRQRPIIYQNKSSVLASKQSQWIIRILVAVILLLLFNNLLLLAEGTSSIAPSADDEAALFIGAGDTGASGGDYGQFAWKGSPSKLSFNIQNTCEKAYFGFSIPKRDRSFRDINPNSGGDDYERNLLFRIVQPNGFPVNDLACFGNVTINGKVWQTLTPRDVNLRSRAQTDIGPRQLNAGGYQAFELDLSACGLNMTGNYSIEFFTRNANYDPNTRYAGFYIEYFDVTIADCNQQAVTGRLWSNNWGLAIKRDGTGPFDRAFNGAFFICSKEGFITKIDFNTQTNNRAAPGKDNDQKSGFRAGAFNVSFNTMGPGKSGNIQQDRQSVPNANSPNPELAVFLNLPDPSFCPPQGIGDFKAKREILTGCPNNYCVNLAFSKLGQIELLIESRTGNRIFDRPEEVRLVQEVTAANLVPNPEDANFPYEVCLNWDGKDALGNRVDLSEVFISGFYFQGIYHFPVYDAEFNDDGFTVETVRPALGLQKVYYDDTLIPNDNLTGESRDGTNGCAPPCHRWTGEFADFEDKNDVFGNLNTINTWWFGNSTFKDFMFQSEVPPTLVCPPNYVGCPGDEIGPNVIGSAQVTTPHPACTVIRYEDRTLSEIANCTGAKVIERTWTVFVEGLEDQALSCRQMITLEDVSAPILSNIPTDETVACNAIPAAANDVSATDGCALPSAISIQLTETVAPQNCSSNQLIRRTWTATDACGNQQSATQILTVIDTVAPILVNIPADQTVDCLNIPSVPNTISAADNCQNRSDLNIAFVELKINGKCAGNYTLERTWTATDACGNANSATQIVTVVDDTAPILENLPIDATVECTNIPAPSMDVRATDNCESISNIDIVFNEDKIDGNCTGNYLLRRTWTATDACGNAASATQLLQVQDTQRPTFIDVPKDEVVDCESVPPVPTVRATDNCEATEDLTITVEEEKIDGICAGNYTLRRTWTASDACGNTSVVTQNITVEDNTAPILTDIPMDITVACGQVPTPETISVTDNCEPTEALRISMSDSRIDGKCAGDYLLKRTWMVADACGNQATRTQTITVQDNESPILWGVPADTTVSCDAVPPVATVTATDNCEADNNIKIVFKEVRLNGNCAGNYWIKRAWTARDGCDNLTFMEQTLHIIDTLAPVFVSCPKDIVVQAVDDCQSDVLNIPLPEVQDNCHETVEVTSSMRLDEPFPIGTNLVILTATDACGNQATCEFFVEVENQPKNSCPDDVFTQIDCIAEDEAVIVRWDPPAGNTCCSSCPQNTSIDDYIFLGERGGHRYYLAQNAQNWDEAQRTSNALGGDLVTIDDPAENAFLQNHLSDQPIYIGLTNRENDGVFYWADDADLRYTNWANGSPPSQKEVVVQLETHGTWTATDGKNRLSYVVEIPCMELIQLEGPLNGSRLPIGEHRISYLMEYDNCPNVDTCSFQVVISPCEASETAPRYCPAAAIDTTCFWIDQVKIGEMVNSSGNNGGYEDFTAMTSNLYTGATHKILLNPGFAPGHTFFVHWKIWLDFNQNGVFDEDELIFTTKEYRPVSVNFQVPFSAQTGFTRMRVSLNFMDDRNPCSVLSFGEVEDYTVQIIPTQDDRRLQDLVRNQPVLHEFEVHSNSHLSRPRPDFTPMDLVALRQTTLAIFPNPATNYIQVQWPETPRIAAQFNDTPTEITLFNQVGQRVLQRTVRSTTTHLLHLDVSSLNSGLYLLQVTQKGVPLKPIKFLKVQ